MSFELSQIKTNTKYTFTVTKTGNNQKQPETTTNDQKPPANDHKPPANNQKPPTNHHKQPQTTTNHKHATTN